jgi:hypothetical protein
MFAYICLGSSDLRRSATFYDAALGVLGYKRCETSAERDQLECWVGWGLYEKTRAGRCGSARRSTERRRPWAMVRWSRCGPELGGVDAFHAAALVHGGTSKGARSETATLAYFYAAYGAVRGNKLAAVCRGFTSG